MNFGLKKPKYFLFVYVALTLIACNTTKYVPDGKYLLNSVKIQSDTKVISKEDIETYLRQTENAKTLGIWKGPLHVYNLSANDTTSWFSNLLKKLGEEPVIYSSDLTSISENEIKKHFFNKGYLNANVTSQVKFSDDKKANLTYNITSNQPYLLRGYTVNISQNEIFNIATDTAESLIKTNKLFDSDILDEERARITRKVRDLGYFDFLKEYLHFYADSTLNSHQVDLVLELNNDIAGLKDTVDNPILKKYTVNKIRFYNEADKSLDQPNTVIKIDTISENSYEFIYEKKQNLRPKLLIETTHLIPNKLYTDLAVEKTYSSLNSLSAVRYMNIGFQKQDSCKLLCDIKLTPNKLQSLSTGVEGTYSAGYLGAGANVSYGHQNLFGGSEAITAKGRFAYEYQGSGQNAIEIGTDLGIKFPTFLFPFASTELKRKIRANTQINTTFSYRKRPTEYTGIIVGGGLKYSWSELANVKHSIDLIDLSFVRYPWISQEYQDSIININPNFRYNFQDHFIMRTGYNGSYTNFNSNKPLKNYYSMIYSVETGGNTLYALNKLFNNKPIQDGDYSYYTLFNIRFAQYVKFDYNISRHQIFNQNNRIVYHAGVGVAIPYGNADVIPFEKRYFAGGANSVRGWTAYQLGPGTYSEARRNYINLNTQMGDVKIDLNMEYRGKLFWKMDGALFLDAGNVWTIKNYNDQPGGAFRFDKFLGQLGIAYGTGLRFDLTYFVIRFDLGVKLFNPALSRTEQWRIKPTSDDFAFNIAIGYPF